MENSPSIKPIAYNYGLLLAAYSILVLVLIYVFSVEQNNWVIAVINALVSITLITLAIRTYKSKNANYLSIKEALKVGLASVAIAGVITAIYTYIHYSFVFPEFIDITKETAYNDMANRGMSEEQINSAMKMSEFTMKPWFFSVITLVSSLFFGFLISLIAGAVMKRKNPAFE